MIKIENVEVMGWEHAIRGMRNPMNSWEKSDSSYCTYSCDDCRNFSVCNLNDEAYFKRFWEEDPANTNFAIGPNDHQLMMNLAHGGPVHAKYRRMITVYLDITAPLYWWKEFDTYKVGTVANSCSTMHKIHAKEFTREDFSFDEELMDEEIIFDLDAEEKDDYIRHTHFEICVDRVVDICECLRKMYNLYVKQMVNPKKTESERKHYSRAAKKCWRMLIQYLPTSYNQKRTVMLNYEVLAAMYESRKNHKLDEWREFCKWIESLPYSELIIGEQEEE